MTSKLSLYNGALRLCGSRPLANLNETGEPKRILDSLYADALEYCVGQGLWNFAMRSFEAIDAPSVTPTFGFTYAFTKPDDWVRTAGVFNSSSESYPLTDYVDEQGYWYANITPIYVRVVSKDPAYGLDLGKWPPSFAMYVQAHLAAEICQQVTESKSSAEILRKLERDRLRDAKSQDAMNEPARFAPTGSWVNSRGGSSIGQRSRWNGQFR